MALIHSSFHCPAFPLIDGKTVEICLIKYYGTGSWTVCLIEQYFLEISENDQLGKKNIQGKVIAGLFLTWLLQGTGLGIAVPLIFGYEYLGC